MLVFHITSPSEGIIDSALHVHELLFRHGLNPSRTERRWLQSRKSESLRRDQLIYLEDLANEFLPHTLHPPHAQGEETLDTDGFSFIPPESPLCALYHPNMTIAVFDFVSGLGLVHKKAYPVCGYYERCWKHFNAPWADRVEMMVRDVEERCECGA